MHIIMPLPLLFKTLIMVFWKIQKFWQFKDHLTGKFGCFFFLNGKMIRQNNRRTNVCEVGEDRGGEREIFARGRIQKISFEMLSSSHVSIATTPNEIFFF